MNIQSIEKETDLPISMDNMHKIESKDNLWKPAPILGKDITQPPPTYIARGLTQVISSGPRNYVLPS